MNNIHKLQLSIAAARLASPPDKLAAWFDSLLEIDHRQLTPCNSQSARTISTKSKYPILRLAYDQLIIKPLMEKNQKIYHGRWSISRDSIMCLNIWSHRDDVWVGKLRIKCEKLLRVACLPAVWIGTHRLLQARLSGFETAITASGARLSLNLQLGHHHKLALCGCHGSN